MKRVEDDQEASSDSDGCTFCQLIKRNESVVVVFEDELTVAFLDHRPLFPGHSLLVPKSHYETLADLPAELVASLFTNAQLLSIAVERAMDAEGTLVAMNNRVSQSVPHVHIHIVPRRRKDGLRGFFWPRQKYKDEMEMASVQHAIQVSIDGLHGMRAHRDRN